jgi:hypothetical protein
MAAAAAAIAVISALPHRAFGVADQNQPTDQTRDLSSTEVVHTETYKFQDGYGLYVGQGKTKIEAQSQAREKCVQNQVMAYEARHGFTPDPDTADLMIDACINK